MGLVIIIHPVCKVTGTRTKRGIGVGLEIPTEITFAEIEVATEWLKKALHLINMMIASHKYDDILHK